MVDPISNSDDDEQTDSVRALPWIVTGVIVLGLGVLAELFFNGLAALGLYASGAAIGTRGIVALVRDYKERRED